MGKDKASIIFGGRPLCERQMELFRELDVEKIFVSARAKPEWLPDGIEVLLDEPPSRGPLSGITRALRVMQTTHLVVLAIDMPFMPRDQMQWLCRQAMPRSGVVPIVDGRPEPLAAVYPSEGVSDFEAALAGDDFSLQPLIRNLAENEKIRLITVPKQAQNYYRSVNEPSDLPGETVSEPNN